METILANVRLGPPRRETLNGRKWLVAPVSMIVSGVLPGSQGALYYPPDETARDHDAWNGMPLTMNHPTDDAGNMTSARRPSILRKFQVGNVYEASFADGRLTGEAWADEDLLKDADKRFGTNVYKRWLAGEPIEVSTGLFTRNDPQKGTFNGRDYVAVARDLRPDHLAILPGQKGACSIQDGCGINVNEAVIGDEFTIIPGVHDFERVGVTVNGEHQFVWKVTENAAPGQVKSKVTGYFKRIGAGFGKGAEHEAAQGGHLVVTDAHKALGADAGMQAAMGNNPPSWAVDESKWERAKAAAEKSGHAEDWPYVVAIYQSMGGETKTENASGECPDGEDCEDQNCEENMATKTENIGFITANCDCWKGQESVLNGLPDSQIQKLRDEAETHKRHELAANVLAKPLKVGKRTFVYNEAKQELVPATNEFPPKEDDEDEEEEEEMADNKKKATANAKPITERLTPAELQVWNLATEIHDERKREIVGKLTANIADQAKKQRLTDNLMKKTLPDLRDMLELQAPAAPTVNRLSADLPEWARVADFSGQGAPVPAALNGSVANGADEFNEIPTFNWSAK